MKKCAILSTDNLEDFCVYDNVAIPHLEARGWKVSEVSWHKEEEDWSQYDVVIVRSTWDYHIQADKLLAVLEKIQAATLLENSLQLIRWNTSKVYLRALSEKGISTIPTSWPESLTLEDLEGAFSHFGVDEIILKPCVSANADSTYRLTLDQVHAQRDSILDDNKDKQAMIQPFLQSVVKEGEYSLFYFTGQLSHAHFQGPVQRRLSCSRRVWRTTRFDLS